VTGGRGFSRVVPMIVACAFFMQNLDSTVVATALPAIGQSLGEDPLRLNLAISSYLLSLAIFVPLSGWMADRFGARTVFRGAILGFMLGSIGCAFADSLTHLVIARILQGLGGSMMIPVGRLVLLRNVPKSELVNAMAYLTIPSLMGPVIGPPLGGFIVTYFSWHWIFLINVPIGIVGIVLVTLLIPEIREAHPGRLDFPGFMLTTFGLTGLVFGLETVGRGAVEDWVTISLVAAGTLAALAYVQHARRTEKPIVDLSLFTIPTYRAAVAGGFLFRASAGALPFLLPMMLQLGFGLSALSSGLITFAAAAGALTMKFTAGPFIRGLGFRRVLLWNVVVSSIFLFVYGLFEPSTPHWLIFVALLVGGFFRSLQFTAMQALSFADVPPERMSHATSLGSMVQQLSQSVGVAFGALILHSTVAFRGASGLGPADFLPPFIGIGLLSLAAILFFLPLAADAGAEVSGHRLGSPARREKAAD
jgi:EmrB/QacA subfamily drug resistance transporter